MWNGELREGGNQTGQKDPDLGASSRPVIVSAPLLRASGAVAQSKDPY